MNLPTNPNGGRPMSNLCGKTAVGFATHAVDAALSIIEQAVQNLPTTTLATHLLNALGGDELAAAATLYRARITGHCHKPGRCVVANWLMRNGVVADELSVSGEEVAIGVWHGTDDSGFYAFEYVPTPKPVGELIRAFDAGIYPQLVTRAGTR